MGRGKREEGRGERGEEGRGEREEREKKLRRGERSIGDNNKKAVKLISMSVANSTV